MTSILCLMGPTASGKTALAAHLRAQLPVELVSVDSALVYRGMDIGTAKPDASLPHRLVDMLDPAESYSAARFREDALAEIKGIVSEGRVPLLVGGTMLYFRALFHGLAEMPPADGRVRAEIDARADTVGWQALHAELAIVDPVAAARIHPNDPQRIQRALEVHALTGQSITALQNAQAVPELPYSFHKLAVAPADRAELHKRIEQRFHDMMAAGFLAEVRTLYERGDLHPDLPAIRAVGYRQLWMHLDGQCGLEEAVTKGIHATRQLAKRQLTWLRSEPDLQWLDTGSGGWLDGGLRWARQSLGL